MRREHTESTGAARRRRFFSPPLIPPAAIRFLFLRLSALSFEVTPLPDRPKHTVHLTNGLRRPIRHSFLPLRPRRSSPFLHADGRSVFADAPAAMPRASRAPFPIELGRLFRALVRVAITKFFVMVISKNFVTTIFAEIITKIFVIACLRGSDRHLQLIRARN